jgi:hypothetical protein
VTARSRRNSATSTSMMGATGTSCSVSISGFGFTSFTGRLCPSTSPTAASLDQNTSHPSRCRSASATWRIDYRSMRVPVCTKSSMWDYLSHTTCLGGMASQQPLRADEVQALAHLLRLSITYIVVFPPIPLFPCSS